MKKICALFLCVTLAVISAMSFAACGGPNVKSIEITVDPHAFVAVGGTPQAAGGKLMVTTADGKSDYIDITDEMIADFDTSKAGPSVCEVRYENLKANYPLCVYTEKEAATDPNTIFVTSDIHENGVGLFNTMNLLAGQVSKIPDAVLTGGDYIMPGANTGIQKYVGEIRNSTNTFFSTNTRISYTMGNHEWQSSSEAAFKADTGFSKSEETVSADAYTVYTLGYPDGDNYSGSGQDHVPQAYIDAVDEYLTGMEGTGKIVFLQSHTALHTGKSSINADRTVINSDKMIDMLNSHADNVDIVYFWGHCHSSYETLKKTVKKRGDTLRCVTGTSYTQQSIDKEIKFTYANSGAMTYMDDNQSAAYVTFDDASLSITYYDLSADLSALTAETPYVVSRNRA